mmetsp:Transcript_46784/g.94383  ORF Transcript_46784/g.94383 Transcript_46784/m.94383 type:complete len:254 (-) Transcript_46784:476-1237(-)
MKHWHCGFNWFSVAWPLQRHEKGKRALLPVASSCPSVRQTTVPQSIFLHPHVQPGLARAPPPKLLHVLDVLVGWDDAVVLEVGEFAAFRPFLLELQGQAQGHHVHHLDLGLRWHGRVQRPLLLPRVHEIVEAQEQRADALLAAHDGQALGFKPRSAKPPAAAPRRGSHRPGHLAQLAWRHSFGVSGQDFARFAVRVFEGCRAWGKLVSHQHVRSSHGVYVSGGASSSSRQFERAIHAHHCEVRVWKAVRGRLH